jgi:protein gp37
VGQLRAGAGRTGPVRQAVLTKDGPRQLIEGLDWVIAGGESGPKARPIRREWVDLLREQCARCGVAFFFKQWGGAERHGWRLRAWTAHEVKQWPQMVVA